MNAFDPIDDPGPFGGGSCASPTATLSMVESVNLVMYHRLAGYLKTGCAAVLVTGSPFFSFISWNCNNCNPSKHEIVQFPKIFFANREKYINDVNVEKVYGLQQMVYAFMFFPSFSTKKIDSKFETPIFFNLKTTKSPGIHIYGVRWRTPSATSSRPHWCLKF